LPDRHKSIRSSAKKEARAFGPQKSREGSKKKGIESDHFGSCIKDRKRGELSTLFHSA